MNEENLVDDPNTAPISWQEDKLTISPPPKKKKWGSIAEFAPLPNG